MEVKRIRAKIQPRAFVSVLFGVETEARNFGPTKNGTKNGWNKRTKTDNLDKIMLDGCFNWLLMNL